MLDSAAFPRPGGVPRRLRVMALVASAAGLLVGYNTAVISGALPSIRLTWALDPATESLIVGALLVGACLGALVGGRLADDLGRRDVIMATTAVFALGTFTSGLAPNAAALTAARLVTGFAVGIVSVAAPLYLAEIAPAVSRGAMISWYQLAITLGILAAYAIDDVLGIAPNTWREMFLGCAGVSMLLGCAAAFIPDSPRWMLLEDDEQEARAILVRLGVHDVDASIRDIGTDLGDVEDRSLAQLARSPGSPLRIGLGLFFFQQLGGINAVIYYSPTILQHAGFPDSSEALFTTLGIGLVNVLLTIVSIRLIDRVGRRTLVLWSLAGMVASLLFLGITDLLFLDSVLPGLARWVVLSSFIGYIASFAIGMGPVCWVVIAELYPLYIRGSAMGIPAMAHWAFDLLVSTSFVVLLRHMHADYLFMVYAGFAAWGYFWCRRYLPETRGRSLEEIQRDWRATVGRSKPA